MLEPTSSARGWIVFAASLTICLPVAVFGAFRPDALADAVVAFTGFVIQGASWWWLILCTGFVVLAAAMALGPAGRIRLGADDERPEFSTPSWIAMLFAGGMGSGLLFWGVAEPATHFASPPGQLGGTPEAARAAMRFTMLHWGFHAWSIYGVCALVIAYFTFRLGRPSMISTPIRTLFRPGRGGGAVAIGADVLGVVAVIFGLAGSLAGGTLQVRAGLGAQFGLAQDLPAALAIIAVMFAAYMTSATTGLDTGIRILSNVNVALAIGIMVFVLFAGPTQFIMETFVDTVGGYLAALPALSFRLFPYEGLTGWSAGWTLTYMTWWLAWGPFVGIFIARISRGRTIREFCAGVILVPVLFSTLWFAVFGGAAIYIDLLGPGGLAGLVAENVSDALFSFFRYFPASGLLSLLATLLVFIFLVTSADSGTFVLSMMTSDGRLDPPTAQKWIWGGLVALITTATVASGSIDVARAMAAAGAIPFSAVLVLQILGFLKALGRERGAGPAPAGAV